MLNGFIKVCAATPKIKVADCEYNASQILEQIEKAAAAGAKLAVFPELCITGYTCGDLFFQDTLLNAAAASLNAIRRSASSADIVIVVGLPLRHMGKTFNCAAVLHRGRILGFVPKKNVPNYNEFYEIRHFTPAPEENSLALFDSEYIPFGSRLIFRCSDLPEFSLACEICEDLWVSSSPSAEHTKNGAAIIANISASDETIGKEDYRRLLVKSQSAKLICGYVYADAGEGESSGDMVFSGHNMIAENGNLLSESPLFSTGLTVSEIDLHRLGIDRRRMNTFKTEISDGYTEIPFSLDLCETALTRKIETHPFVPASSSDRDRRSETILSIQSLGLKKRLEHTGVDKAVIAVSGGLDSTLALIVACNAMDMLSRPRTDVIAVTMPCFGTTRRTRSNAEALALALGVSFREIDITAAVEQHFSDIAQDRDNTDVTYENSQARERTQVVMDIANSCNGLVIGTGDLSELALGWATYNGDHMSMYGVNASVPKTLIRHIIKYTADKTDNRALCGVLLDILDTPVSPELLPALNGDISQKTEMIVGPYELHDFFLYYVMRWGCTPGKLLRLAEYAFKGSYSREVILSWLKVFYRRFFSQQFKRSCLPDGPKVGSVTLSPRSDWRMPSDASAELWLKELEAL
ncbi:MAG: NAD(+) synthase [Oscillospiraceae bacterium]|jgi:NAD+ synthase (glutamine-hydrolysing)|nr:NAD(+) synthase [Oscillospiraceae bacterium]